MTTYFRNHPWTLGALAISIAGLAWLAFGFFGVQTLFFDDEVSEALPTFDATPDQPVPASEPQPAVAPPAVTQPAVTQPEAPMPDEPEVVEVEATLPPPAPAVAEIVTEYSGTFESDAHPTSGTAVVLGNGTDQRFLRFENFETDNGPDLNVYLVNSSTGDVSDFVDLGDLKGNIGEQNYEIPVGVDLDVYDEVVVWCVRFGVGFGDALLSPA
jgi:hypothetical protein